MKGDVEVIYHNKLRGLTSQISCRWPRDVLNYETIFSQFNSSWLPTQISWLHFDRAYHFIGMKLWCHSDIFQGDTTLRTIPKSQYWYFTHFCLHYTLVLPVIFVTFDLLAEVSHPALSLYLPVSYCILILYDFHSLTATPILTYPFSVVTAY